MARVHPFQTNFTAGELTPKLAGQVDFKKYNNGVEIMENMTVFPQGGASRRYGTRFVKEVKDSSKVTRLIPFEFNIEQSYVLEFGDQYIRFYKDNGQITSGGSAYEIATPFTESMLYEIQFTQSADVMYIVHETLTPRKLSRTGHTSWTLTEVEFQNGPYLDANESSVTFTSSHTGVGTGRTLTASASTFECSPNETGFHTDDIGRLVKMKDGWGVITGYTSPTVVTWEIKQDLGSATATTDWALGAWSEHTGYPKTVSFFEQRLVFGGSTAYPQTIWASESGFYEHFHAGDGSPADSFIYTIAANKVNTIRWLAPARDLIVGTAGGEFKVGRPTGEPLQPDNVQITQQTTYGGYSTQPIQIGNAVLFVQRQKKKIRELAYRFEDDAYLAPDMTLLAEHITGNGVVDVDYAQEPQSIYWAVREDGTLLGLTYQREEDVVAWHRHIIGGSFKQTFDAATDVTPKTTDPNFNGYITITNHGFETGDKVLYKAGGGTKLGGLQDNKYYYIIKIDANNIEFADSYEQAIDRTVLQITAGVGTQSIEGQAKVKSVCTISEDLENQTWVIVERKVNGSIVKHIEYLDKKLNMDSALSTTVNASSSTITGLDHLEGESVQILIGDAVYPNQTVSSGSITISLPANTGYKSIEIGLGYISQLKTMRVEAGASAGTAQGRKKRYNEVLVRLHKTVGININGDQLPFRTSSTPMGQNISEFTGDKRVINLGWDRDGQIIIKQEQPLPMTVLGITGTLVTSD
jgi:hypothetical protein